MILLFTYLSCGAVFAQDAGPEIDPFAGINEETDWNVFDQERGSKHAYQLQALLLLRAS
jgi:hypothetical protein